MPTSPENKGFGQGDPKLARWAESVFAPEDAVLHEIRSEYAQLMSCAFLLLAGPGPLSIDAAVQVDPETGRDDRVAHARSAEVAVSRSAGTSSRRSPAST